MSRQTLAIGLLAILVFASCASQSGSDSSASVDSVARIDVTNASLYTKLKGANHQLPLLLWLHGGPGGAERPLFQLYNSDFEKEFVVAYLDQRGAGRSFVADTDPSILSIEQHLLDLDAVVDHLRNEFSQEKVVLVGHSWGGALGLLYVEKYPDKVSALICAAPLIAVAEGQGRQLAFLRTEAARLGESPKLESMMEGIGAPPLDWEDDLTVQGWIDRYGGVFHKPINRWRVLFAGTFKGLVWPWEIPGYIKANNISLSAMNNELGLLDLRKSIKRLNVPVLFALGDYDRVTDSGLATEFFDQVEAPRKKLVRFEDSAHNVPFEEPGKFFQAATAFTNGVPK